MYLYLFAGWVFVSLIEYQYTLVARHNAERIQPLLTAYKWRILGLAIVIAIVLEGRGFRPILPIKTAILNR
ncbi:hypothetical protein PMG71_18155 [Roseofilum sp. BLCC_M154]|uniref:Uncharacterized protein n=1 Tax=Roseofilum acuticapitatum BLCC-M154 TaxID=3022444 RepID=A0ABT7AWS8_9CYAN|nr:hypothetical protein [Roseofilum acuticapitatum]MDJ1171357.1 hypothetical protein [Roseofilum acuticapitatum BLCC-M154]